MATCLSSNVKIVDKPNTTSPIWTYFGLGIDSNGKPDKDKTLCRICESPVLSKGGNTSNLFTHLKRHHPKKFVELQYAVDTRPKEASCSSNNKSKSASSKQQSTIVEIMEKSKQYERHGRKWESLTSAVTACLCKDMLPIYTVEKPGFRKMLQPLTPCMKFHQESTSL